MKHDSANNARMPILRERLLKLQGDMSATDFADKLGLSRQTVGFYLSGKRIPDSETLAQICNCCNVSADWLLGLSKDPNIESPTVDQLGLSPRAVAQLSQIRFYKNADAVLQGLNLLIENGSILTLSGDLAQFCDKVREFIEVSQLYKDTIAEDEDDDFYKFKLAANEDIIRMALESTISTKFPQFKNEYQVIIGSRMIEYQKRFLVDFFDEIVRQVSNYQEFSDNILQQKDIMK